MKADNLKDFNTEYARKRCNQRAPEIAKRLKPDLRVTAVAIGWIQASAMHESRFFGPLESVAGRLEKLSKNPIYSITC